MHRPARFFAEGLQMLENSIDAYLRYVTWFTINLALFPIVNYNLKVQINVKIDTTYLLRGNEL